MGRLERRRQLIPKETIPYYHQELELSGIQSSLSKRERYTKGGNQTMPTQRIKAFAANYPDTLKGIQKMVNDIARFEFIREIPRVAEAVYGRRHAEDVIVTKKIPTPFLKKVPKWGCNDQITALLSALRAKGIHSKFVRTIYDWESRDDGASHTVALIKPGKKFGCPEEAVYVADPFRYSQEKGAPIFQQVGIELRERIAFMKKEKRWHEGVEAWEMGIRSIEDYNKYNPDFD